MEKTDMLYMWSNKGQSNTESERRKSFKKSVT